VSFRERIKIFYGPLLTEHHLLAYGEVSSVLTHLLFDRSCKPNMEKFLLQ